MKGFEITEMSVDATGYIAEENLEEIASTVFFDHATGTLLVQTCDKVLAITTVDHDD